jgi:tetratricopeptide (TPR) repeat protein
MNKGASVGKWLKPALMLLVVCCVEFGAEQSASARSSHQRSSSPPSSPKVDEKPVFELAEKLGHQPELMTPEYLKYLLGHPAKCEYTTFNMTYHWQTNKGGIGTQYCTLTERRDANHQLVQAIMRIDMPESDKTLVDVEKRIEGEDNQNTPDGSAANGSMSSNGYWSPNGFVSGSPSGHSAPPPINNVPNGNLGALAGSLAPPYQDYNQKPHGKKLFDQECRPSLRYSFVPNTFVTYTQASRTPYVHRIEISYAGPPLPPPSQLEIESVAIGMRTRALAHHSNELHNLAVPMLNDHLYDNPADAEAHYYLGLSYQKTGNLNNAIREYQTALRYSWDNPDIAQKSAQSLQELHVLPSPDDKFAFHDLKFKAKGQGLVEGDVNATQDRETVLASSTAGNYIPGGYVGSHDMPLLFSPGTRLLAPMGQPVSGVQFPSQFGGQAGWTPSTGGLPGSEMPVPTGGSPSYPIAPGLLNQTVPQIGQIGNSAPNGVDLNFGPDSFVGAASRFEAGF